jgi:hypothetical protein
MLLEYSVVSTSLKFLLKWIRVRFHILFLSFCREHFAVKIVELLGFCVYQ